MCTYIYICVHAQVSVSGAGVSLSPLGAFPPRGGLPSGCLSLLSALRCPLGHPQSARSEVSVRPGGVLGGSLGTLSWGAWRS